MTSANVFYTKTDYQSKFDSPAFLEHYVYDTPENTGRLQHVLQCYHSVFGSLPNGLKVLEFGSGPVVMGTISAVTKASEIVLSDLTDKNRQSLRLWLDGSAAAFDWSKHFRYVVQELEGKDEGEVEKRQEQVRKSVRAVVTCDLTEESLIEDDYNHMYDVVISSLVLESVANTHEEYGLLMRRLGKLVKPGGLLLIYGVESKVGFYNAGVKFRDVGVNSRIAMSSMKDAGFCDLTISKFATTQDQYPMTFMFMKGTRSLAMGKS